MRALLAAALLASVLAPLGTAASPAMNMVDLSYSWTGTANPGWNPIPCIPPPSGCGTTPYAHRTDIRVTLQNTGDARIERLQLHVMFPGPVEGRSVVSTNQAFPIAGNLALGATQTFVVSTTTLYPFPRACFTVSGVPVEGAEIRTAQVCVVVSGANVNLP